MGQKEDGTPRAHIECGLLQGGALRKRKYEGRQQTVTPASELQKILEELYRSHDHTMCPVVVRLLQPIYGIDDSFSGLSHHNVVIFYSQAASLNGSIASQQLYQAKSRGNEGKLCVQVS